MLKSIFTDYIIIMNSVLIHCGLQIYVQQNYSLSKILSRKNKF